MGSYGMGSGRSNVFSFRTGATHAPLVLSLSKGARERLRATAFPIAREIADSFPIARDERFLLRTAPTLDAALRRECLIARWKAVTQDHVRSSFDKLRTSGLGNVRKVVVSRQAALVIASGAKQSRAWLVVSPDRREPYCRWRCRVREGTSFVVPGLGL